MITLNFDVSKEAAGLPNDTYEFEITKLEHRQSSTGNPMVSIELTVINHPDYNGKRVFDNIVLLPQTAFRLHNLCKALNVNAQNIPDDLDEARQLGWLDAPVFAETEFKADRDQVQIKKYVAGKS